MSLVYNGLFWFVFVTTLMSGGLGFLLKVPNFYFPNVYLIGPKEELTVGTGTTPFEILASYVFGIVYVGPLVGMLFAFYEGSAAALRASLLMPLVYHTASIFGVLWVFPHAMNPAMTTLASAAGMHAFYAVLLCILFVAAKDADKMKIM